MFGKKKETSSLPKQLQDFLTAADDVYMRSFAIKSIKVLSKHFSRECCIKLSRAIYGEGNFRFFGTDKFRTTTWKIDSEESGILKILKTVDFDKVKISKNFKMQIADNYSEMWYVRNDDYLVVNIVRLE